MGCGASVARPTARSKDSSTRPDQRTKVQTQPSEGLNLFVILFFFVPSFLIKIYNEFI
jgi:hypothetical protein